MTTAQQGPWKAAFRRVPMRRQQAPSVVHEQAAVPDTLLHIALPCMSRVLQGLVLPFSTDRQAVWVQALRVAVPAVVCPPRLGLLLGLLLEARPALSDAGEVGGGQPARRGRPTSRLDASGVPGRVRLDTLTCNRQVHSARCKTASPTHRSPLRML